MSRTVAEASAVPLLATPWRVTQLEDQVVENPAGPAAMRLQLVAENSRAVGFAGCNRLFGGYALSNDRLRFAQVGATRMACADAARMELEQRYLDLLSRVVRWQIIGDNLQLLDEQGRQLLTFSADATPR